MDDTNGVPFFFFFFFRSLVIFSVLLCGMCFSAAAQLLLRVVMSP
jgi:hypothetical protein